MSKWAFTIKKEDEDLSVSFSAKNSGGIMAMALKAIAGAGALVFAVMEFAKGFGTLL